MRSHDMILLPHRTGLRSQLIASSCVIHRREKDGRCTTSFRLSHTVHRRLQVDMYSRNSVVASRLRSRASHTPLMKSNASSLPAVASPSQLITHQLFRYISPILGTSLLFSLGSPWLMHIASAHIMHPLFTTSVSRNASKAFLGFIRTLIAIPLT
jgi:hypothetical protein